MILSLYMLTCNYEQSVQNRMRTFKTFQLNPVLKNIEIQGIFRF